MISMGSAAALKNLLSARPNLGHIEGDRLIQTNRPGLHVRKQKALETEIDQNLSETCENLESPTGSPTETRKHDPIKHKFLLTNDGRHGMQHVDGDRKLQMRGPVYPRGGSADNSPLVEHRLHSPSRGVTRSGSQDSVGSTHSDISHDRGRIQSLIMKGSRFTPDRQEEGGNSDMSPRDGSERTAYSSHSGSRIAKVMQEVVQHAEHNGDLNECSYNHELENGMQRSLNNGQEVARIPVFKGHQHGYRPKDTNNAVEHHNDRHYRGQRGEPRDLDLPEQDEPINYSMKYPTELHRHNNQIPPNQTSAFNRPLPKVQNFVSNGPVSNETPTHTKDLHNQRESKGRNKSGNVSQNFSDYGQPDPDQESMDQMTNFSVRYMEEPPEEFENEEKDEQPINYSTGFRERPGVMKTKPIKPKPVANHRNHRANPPEAAMLDEDTLQTFCTEGTPLTFLSTATSMNDLSKVGKDEASPLKNNQQSPQEQGKAAHYPESERMSGTGTHSTERNTGSTVVYRGTGESTKTPAFKASPVQKMSPPQAPNSHPPSMYSYNDSTSASSPSDKPRAYCTEGTPMSFSRHSSLSSLHSADARDMGKKGDMSIEDMEDNANLDMSSADVTLKPELAEDSFIDGNHSADTSNGGQCKTVTFDENNQVHETPLMFSRCSSLGSLSSFDSHSVHSSVVSEYSRRASEVVSPSELPDSPSDTMPSSPSRNKSPVRFGDNQAPVKAEKMCDKQEKLVKLDPIPECMELSRSTELHRPQPIYKDNMTEFADEGSPPDGNFSSATSLSALTFDDEPAIRKDPGLRKVPLGQETDPEPRREPSVNLFQSKEESRQNEHEKEEMSDDDNSSVSEGEENLLAEFISLAMPSNSKKKIKKSSSDGIIKQKCLLPIVPKPMILSKIPSSASAGSLLNRSRIPMPNKPIARVQGSVIRHDDTLDGQDSPRKFATEGTPLNYSRAESLSDISMESQDGDGIDKTMDTVIDVQAQKRLQPIQVDEDHSDLSSISDDDEDLLSEAIQSAMPKSGKKKSTSSAKAPELDRMAEGCDSKQKARYQQPLNMTKKAQPAAMHHDTMRTFAVEDTPISMSHATSFTDLTVDDHDMDVADGASEGGLNDQRTAAKPSNNPPAAPAEDSLDSTKIFGIEGTPMLFSRNDSLSSLSCDEEIFEDLVGNKVSLADELQQSGNKKAVKKSKSPRKPNLETVALSRLKTPGKGIPYGPSITSTPLAKKAPSPHHPHHPAHHEELPQTFMTEDTPMCFSRNSSLSSLGCRDEEHNRALLAAPAPQSLNLDQSANYRVEDTPANFSGDGSLSSLSVASLSFEATPSESALLEECINAALPKSKKKKKESPSHHTSPTADTSSKKKTPRTELFVETKSQPSKNLEGPQAKSEEKKTPEVVMRTKPSPDEETQSKEDRHSKRRSSDIIYLEGEEEEDGSDVDLEYEDQKLVEAIQEVESKVADFDFKNEEPSKKPLCLEAHQLPKHLLHRTTPGQLTNGDMGKSLDFTTSIGEMDLMRESFPEMSCSLVSNLTTPDQEEPPPCPGEQGSGDTTMADTTVINTLQEEDEEEEEEDTDEESGFGLDEYLGNDLHEMSNEEQQALEENANLILSELRDMTGSIIDDGMFIDNETLSLVSNDCTSDTASEASECLSSCSQAPSVAASDVSTALSVNSSATCVIEHPKIVVAPGVGPNPGPRIVKPVGREGPKQQQQKQENSPKGIRGGKKLASAAIRGVASAPNVRSPAKTTPAKTLRGGPQKPKTPVTGTGRGTPVKRAPPTKNTPPKTPAGRGISRVGSAPGGSKTTPPTRSSSTPPKSALANSPKTSPKLNRRASSTGRQITPPKANTVRPATASGIPKPGQRNSPKGQAYNSPKNNQTIERPAPPIKQGTFTKESPTNESTPDVSQDSTDHNGNNAAETRKSLVDKKSPSGPAKVIKLVDVKKDRPSSSGSPSQRVSPLGKDGEKAKTGSGSKGSLNKTSSGSSLNQTSSNTSLNKSMNNNNRTPLKRMGSQKGEGVTRRNSAGNTKNNTPPNRSSTPAGRATPNGKIPPVSRSQSAGARSTPTRQPSTTPDTELIKPVKKPAVSKIAALWRRDKKTESNNQVTTKDKQSDSVELDSKPSKGSMKRLGKLGKSKKEKGKDLALKISTEDLDGGIMKRSSTYDKLIPDTPEVASQVNDGGSSTDNVSTPSLQSLGVSGDEKSMWRRTYTIAGSEEDRSSDAVSMEGQTTDDEMPAKGPKVKKEKRLSLWRRHSQEDSKAKDSDAAKMPPPKKKGFSLWRRDTKKESKVQEAAEQPVKSRPSPPTRLEGSSLPIAAIKSTPNQNPTIVEGAGMISAGSPSPLTSPNKPPNAAIVAPYNYNPNQGVVTPPDEVIQDDKLLFDGKKMTKTEMLIARRQSYLNNRNSNDGENREETDGKRSACLVTTV